MWHILLMVLEILGIILAVLLGLILLLLICLLFVPFSYRVKGNGGYSEEKKEFQLLLSLSWLFLGCKGRIRGMPAEMRWVVRLFFFPLYDSAKRSDRTKKEEADEPQWEALVLPEQEGALWEEEAASAGDNPAGEIQSETDSDAGETEHTDSGQTEEAGKGERKIKTLYQRLISIKENIQYTIQNICDKIKAILSNITYYTDLIQGEVFRQAFSLSRKELFRILRSIRPRKGRLHIEAGLGDPASTGQLVSFYGILYPWIGKYILLQTDFEEKRLEADGFLKGRITIIVLLIAGLRLYLNKNLKRVIRMLKKEDIQNG